MKRKTNGSVVTKVGAMFAISALASTACAQSSVTIYGAIDAYVARYTATGSGGLQGVNSGYNPNNLGFSMREDLGGGLVAGGVLEMQPVLDTGTLGQGNKMFGRQSLVYLGGVWGTFSLGRIHTPGRALGIKQAATGWLASDPSGNLLVAMGSSLAPLINVDTTGSRLSNAVHYVSPLVGGFRFTLMHSLDEKQTLASGSGKVTTGGVSYASGAFTADLVFSKIYEIGGSQVRQSDLGVGATYDLKVAKLYGTVYQRKGSAVATVGSTTPLAGTDKTDRLVNIGVSVPVAGTDALGFGISWSRVDDAHRGLFAANTSAPFAARLDDAKALAVTYTMNLSKRTQWFAAYGALENAAQGTGSINPGLRPAAGGRSTILASGIRHNF